jgi:hypothetical protein
MQPLPMFEDDCVHRHTYGDPEAKDEKKTVQVVKELCRKYEGSHRTVMLIVPTPR